MQTSLDMGGPGWDNTREYPSFDSEEFNADLDRVPQLIQSIESLSEKISPWLERADSLSPEEARPAVEASRQIYELRQEAFVLIRNLDVFAKCEADTDSKNDDAKKMIVKIQGLYTSFERALKPVTLFLMKVSDEVANDYLNHAKTREESFHLSWRRRKRDQVLSLAEEKLAASLELDGYLAWGNLYSNIASSLRCTLDLPGKRETVGLAKASGLLRGKDSALREAAWRSIRDAWELQQESCSSILNALAGWRLEMGRQRSKKRVVHFLEEPLETSRIEKRTLDAMMAAVSENTELGRRALRIMAKVLGKKQLGPWDIFAGPPELKQSKSLTFFDDALKMVEDAFSGIHPDMGKFVRMMSDEKWIEAQVSDSKQQGAHCTGFTKSRSPRVFMTFMGSYGDVRTLAHELGHAFHSWVMRDLPIVQTAYPMTIAETASIFSETVLQESLSSDSGNAQEQLRDAWAGAQEAATFLLNIPMRYDFEYAFYDARQTRPFSAQDLRALMRTSWEKYYGDAVSEPDDLFWAGKLHFYIARTRFYNFPYTFGYLFALGVYAQKERLGGSFFDAYVALLRDTGRMPVEELAMKHLGKDITKPEFWNDSLAKVKASVDSFEKLSSAI